MPPDSGKTRVERELFVRAFLSTTPPARVASQLSKMMRDRHVAPGEVVYRRGDDSHELYFIVSGCIQVSAPQRETWAFGSGSMLGLFDASIPRPRTRTATAGEPSHLLELDVVDYLDIIEDNFGFAVDTLVAGAREQCKLAEQLGSATEQGEADLGRSGQVAADSDWDAIDCLLLLRKVGLFKAAPVQALAQLARLGRVRRWPAGAYLFKAGDPVRDLQVVAGGSVVTEPGLGREPIEFHPASIVSGLAPLGGESHDRGALAPAPAVTLAIDLEDLFDVAEDHFEVCRSMLAWIASTRADLSEEAARRQLEIGRTTI